MNEGDQPWENMMERYFRPENSLCKGPVVGSKKRTQSGWTDRLP